MTTGPTPFDLAGPLPTGTVVLEASAGTGKTYALAALATRYVAEGYIRLPQLLLITFTRAATGELRSRVYDRLLQCRGALQDYLVDGTHPSDPVDTLLTSGDPETVADRLSRIDGALADIDLATIATIHEFAGRMLTELGALADHDPTDVFVEDLTDLKHQVAADSYLLHSPKMPLNDFQQLIIQALENNSVPLVASAADTPLLAVVEQAREEYSRRKKQLRIFGYNDMMERLSRTLCGPHSERAAAVLSERFPVALVDEFQDTDPEQWDILRQAFLGRSTLVLIGDPKQAIYRFRGADVFAYLEAVREADSEQTLSTNYRADTPLVQAVSQLFATANLGTFAQPISVPPVAAHHAGSRLRTVKGDPLEPAAELRVINASKPLYVGTARKRISDDLCSVVADLLDHTQLLRGTECRQLGPGDIAVLVSRNRRAEELRDALAKAGIAAAIVSGAQSVLLSDAATEWLTLLEAVADATPARIARLAISPLVGLTAAAVATTPELLVNLRAGVSAAASRFRVTGAPGLLEWLRATYDLTPRIISLPDGERMLTDIRHIAEILGTIPARNNATELATWLADRIRTERQRRTETRSRSRRLETGRRAVQILTVHAAKGLEFPVVLLPEAADLFHSTKNPHSPGVVIHRGSERLFDISAARTTEVEELFRTEERADTLRQLYVATTRAASRLVMWWAPTSQNLAESGLQMLLSGPGSAPTLQPNVSRLSPELFKVTAVSAARRTPAKQNPPAQPALSARRFERSIDHTWTRTSYSGLTAGLHEFFAGVDEPLTDEPMLLESEHGKPSLGESSIPPGKTAVAQEPFVAPLAHLPAGPLFGTIVHEALEHLDPTAPRLPARLDELCQRFVSANPIAGLDPQELSSGLLRVLNTPLGSLAPGCTLADFGPANRLAELSFEMPIGAKTGNQTVAELAALFDDPALVSSTDLLQPYGKQLSASPAATQALSGFLTGSIDVVLRRNEGDFVVIDYKTNRFPTPTDRDLLVTDYSPSAMAWAMMRAHYPLQALLYAVALKRHLSWRLPNSDPNTLLGGIGYLFVRGMAGPTTPLFGEDPCGVFVWHPTPALVSAASEVLGGGR